MKRYIPHGRSFQKVVFEAEKPKTFNLSGWIGANLIDRALKAQAKDVKLDSFKAFCESIILKLRADLDSRLSKEDRAAFNKVRVKPIRCLKQPRGQKQLIQGC